MAEEQLLTFETLYDSPMMAVRGFLCLDTKHEHSPEEQSDHNSITLLRHGAFTKHFGKRAVVADVNQTAFFSKDSVYRVSHPGDCGDRGTSFVVGPTILTDIIRELDPSVDERPEQPFPFVTAPSSQELFLRHRDYIRRLERRETEPLELLWADVVGLQLIADVLETAFVHYKELPAKRASTAADHSERTEAAKTFMAARLGEQVTLGEIADAVNASPFNFARIFQQQTGMPIHRYLTRLRMRASLERVADGEDLTSLAIDLGYSSHSHFTDVFKREFGMTPSEYRGSNKQARI